jgi:hypothetical protein
MQAKTGAAVESRTSKATMLARRRISAIIFLRNPQENRMSSPPDQTKLQFIIGKYTNKMTYREKIFPPKVAF